MAKFNEQMTGIFSLIKQMDGIRFGREITEPTIQAPIFKSEGETIELETRKVASAKDFIRKEFFWNFLFELNG
ncbi:unnamed protein product [Meloidogyne enterolobii]|uniref:Uncharacterized protein n=1 Tax=Meloidogyne enterolobii TaxID=390850 RepID=A0ACB0YZZ8_MELEN